MNSKEKMVINQRIMEIVDQIKSQVKIDLVEQSKSIDIDLRKMEKLSQVIDNSINQTIYKTIDNVTKEI